MVQLFYRMEVRAVKLRLALSVASERGGRLKTCPMAARNRADSQRIMGSVCDSVFVHLTMYAISYQHKSDIGARLLYKMAPYRAYARRRRASHTRSDRSAPAQPGPHAHTPVQPDRDNQQNHE